jgi:hypothetical protein
MADGQTFEPAETLVPRNIGSLKLYMQIDFRKICNKIILYNVKEEKMTAALNLYLIAVLMTLTNDSLEPSK